MSLKTTPPVKGVKNKIKYNIGTAVTSFVPFNVIESKDMLSYSSHKMKFYSKKWCYTEPVWNGVGILWIIWETALWLLCIKFTLSKTINQLSFVWGKYPALNSLKEAALIWLTVSESSVHNEFLQGRIAMEKGCGRAEHLTSWQLGRRAGPCTKKGSLDPRSHLCDQPRHTEGVVDSLIP